MIRPARRLQFGVVETSVHVAARDGGGLAKLAEAPVLATFVLTSLPEAWTRPLRLGDVSLVNILFCLTALAAIAAALRAGMPKPLYLAAASLSMVYMAAIGRVNSDFLPFDEKFYYADLLTFLGLIAGYMWSGAITAFRLARFVRIAALLAALILAGSHVLLYLGILTPVWGGQRVFVWSVFTASWWILVLLPVISATAEQGTGKASSYLTRALVASCLLAVCVSSLLSGTRSTLLQVAICAAICVRWQVKSAAHVYAIAACLAAAGIGFYAVSGWESLNLNFLAERMQGTQVRDEQRYVELQMMFDHLAGDIWTGQGFGVFFTSPVIVNGSPLAIAPHIAIFTLLLKGGVLIFAALIVIPGIVALARTLAARGKPIADACWGSVLLYLTASSMSGGWGFFHLFLYGLFLGLALRQPRQAGGIRA